MKALLFKDVHPVILKAIVKEYPGEPVNTDTNAYALYMELLVIQMWLREEKDVHLVIDRESIGSDEMVYVYKIQWLPQQFKDAKRRVVHFEYIYSMQFSGGATYSGGWDDYPDALLEGVKKALEVVP